MCTSRDLLLLAIQAAQAGNSTNSQLLLEAVIDCADFDHLISGLNAITEVKNTFSLPTKDDIPVLEQKEVEERLLPNALLGECKGLSAIAAALATDIEVEDDSDEDFDANDEDFEAEEPVPVPVPVQTESVSTCSSPVRRKVLSPISVKK